MMRQFRFIDRAFVADLAAESAMVTCSRKTLGQASSLTFEKKEH
jgi:hypothetical protein